MDYKTATGKNSKDTKARRWSSQGLNEGLDVKKRGALLTYNVA